MARILVVIGSHLSTAPRPQKEAQSLTRAGHSVKIFGIWLDADYAERDKGLIGNFGFDFSPVCDFRSGSLVRRISRLKAQFRGRLARDIYRNFEWYSPELSGYGVRRMLAAAASERADLTIVHAESGLWIAHKLLRLGLQVGVDFEDWFSEDIPQTEKSVRPVKHLKRFESELLHSCSYSLATSNVMADHLAATYRAPRPSPIYNAFPKSDRKSIDRANHDRRDRTIPSLVWFSQTIGMGRGLESVLAVLPQLKCRCEIHLRGAINQEMKSFFESLCPSEWRAFLFFHPTVPNEELLSRLVEHDIGLAIDQKNVLSRDLTVTNKLFHYLQAGLAIVATETQGNREILDKAGAAVEYADFTESAMAAAINRFISDTSRLARAKAASLAAFENHFCWELQEPALVDRAGQSLAAVRTL